MSATLTPSPDSTTFSDPADVIKAISRGYMVVVVDDEDRENEGDLIIAAQHCTPEAINFMITKGKGLVCLALTQERATHLQLVPMVERNSDHMGTNFTVSIDASPTHGVRTGISATERAKTIELALTGHASDLHRPGHIFPLVAHPDGIQGRQGHTEVAVDLARFAGCLPAGVIVEIIGADGEMLRGEELRRFAHLNGLHFTSIEAMREYALQKGLS